MDSPSIAFSPLRSRLADHEVYGAVRTDAGLRTFMEHHVVCVLDFMSLVKRIQAELTCTRFPWTPAEDAALARFINEIVTDEESDAAFGDKPASHFEWYLAAMEEVGADTGPIQGVVDALREGQDPLTALENSALPPAARAFGQVTFQICLEPLPSVASAFLHGREDLIPQMFLPLVRELEDAGRPVTLFRRYLERHIEVDGETHGPLATQMLDGLFAGRADVQEEAEAAAIRSLQARLDLWNAIATALREDDPVVPSVAPRPRDPRSPAATPV